MRCAHFVLPFLRGQLGVACCRSTFCEFHNCEGVAGVPAAVSAASRGFSPSPVAPTEVTAFIGAPALSCSIWRPTGLLSAAPTFNHWRLKAWFHQPRLLFLLDVCAAVCVDPFCFSHGLHVHRTGRWRVEGR